MKLDVVAFHEAGHAVVAWHEQVRIRKVSIVAEATRGGFVAYASPLAGIRLDADGSDRARLRAEKLIRVTLAGAIAQRLYRRRSFRRWHSAADDEQAANLALLLEGSGERATAYLRWLGLVTTDELQTWWWLVEKVAGALLDRRVIAGADVAGLADAGVTDKGRAFLDPPKPAVV